MAENVIYTIRVTFKPLEDIIVPAFSSKFSYTILRELLDDELRKFIDEKHSSREPLKPYRVSVVFNAKGKALYKTPSSRRILVLRKEWLYWFTSTLILDSFQVYPVIPKSSVKTKLGEVELVDVKVTTRSFSDLVDSEQVNSLKISFVTPTLLSAKLCLPPRVRVDTVFNVYRLFPQPCLWLRSLVLYWNKYAPRGLRFRDGYRLCRFGDVLLAETEYSVRPVSVVYGKGGSVVVHRGFVGWVKYRVVEDWFAERIAPLLRLAELVGVGRSRSIGFGHVVVKYET